MEGVPLNDWMAAFEFLILLLVNIAIGAVGFVPSVFLTPINLDRFGLAGGSVLTFSGEIFGALAGFWLYRFGANRIPLKFREHRLFRYFGSLTSRNVFWSVLFCRLLPFMPSGLITAAAAITKIRAGWFFTASTFGKLPAVAIEISLVFGLTLWLSRTALYGLLLAAIAIFAVSAYWRNRRLSAFRKI